MSRRLALVTTAEYRALDTDLDLLVEALDGLGVDARLADWHDDDFDWSSVDLVVVRSPWDYTWQLPAFLTWAEQVASATRLANPFEVLRWNTDKRYLVQLAAQGAPVVPTSVFEPGDDVALPDAAEYVIKPVVSAGGRDTERYPDHRAEEALVHARTLLAAGRAVLVQPYLDAIEVHGETGLVYAGDLFSHAFRKAAILVPGVGWVDGHYRDERIDPREPTPFEHRAAEAVLDAVGACLPGFSRADLLYARVDLVPGPDGDPLLLELELTEPSLFCAAVPGSAARVAAAFARALP